MGGNKGIPIRPRQDAYIQARTSGMSENKARDIAGYTKNTNPNQIERSAYVQKEIKSILDEKGLTDDYLAEQYKISIAECSQKDAKSKDMNAKSQLLKQLGYLRGHGKSHPAVAVQINNSTGKTPIDGPGEVGELVAEVRDLVGAIREEIQNRKSDGVHLRSIEDGRSQAYQDMAQSIEEPRHAGGGGG